MKTKNMVWGLLASAFWLNAIEVYSADGPPPLPPPPAGKMLNRFDFNTTNWLNARSLPPLAFTNIDCVPSWASNALQVDSQWPAYLTYREVETNGATNFVCDNGTFLFFFKPNWNSQNHPDGGEGPGTWARFFECGEWTTNASIGAFSLYLDTAGTNLYFAGQTNGAEALFLVCPIEPGWSSNEYHQICLVYSPSNSALFLDGVSLANGAGVSVYPGPQTREASGLFIGSDSQGTSQFRGQIEKFTTFNYPMDAMEIEIRWATFIGSFGQFYNNGMSGPTNGGDSMITLELGFGEMMDFFEYSTNDLWLDLVITGEVAVLTLHNTTPGVLYQIFSTELLASNVIWQLEQEILGAEGQDWSQTALALNQRTNLFFRAGSGEDSDGDGLPDLYETYKTLTDPIDPDTGNTGVLDGFKDPDGDGWTNMDEYRNQTEPFVFNTPPPPQGFSVRLDSTGTNAVLTWNPGFGTVVEYGIDKWNGFYWEEVSRVNNSTFSFTTSTPNPLGIIEGNTSFRIKAYYGGGISSTGEYKNILKQELTPVVRLVRGTLSEFYAVFSAAPKNASHFRFFWYTYDNQFPYFEISATNLVNGLLVVPKDELARYPWHNLWVQAVSEDGQLGIPVWLGYTPELLDFIDASPHMRENLMFLLRAATVNYQFLYESTVYYEGLRFARYTNQEAYQFYDFSIYRPGHSVGGALWPIMENYLFRNFVSDTNRMGYQGGGLTNVSFNSLGLLYNLTYPVFQFTGAASNNPAAPLGMSAVDSRWLYFAPIHGAGFSSVVGNEVGVTTNNTSKLYFNIGVSNFFGLPLNSVQISLCCYVEPFVLFPGDASTIAQSYTKYYYPEVAVPNLHTEDYFFAAVSADGSVTGPGSPAFSVTNTTPLIVAAVGQPIHVAGWAKKKILNGDPNKFAYLGQYFDKAYKANPDGTRSTNVTGILSEYGEFFPTEPGLVILTTKPDEYNFQGECPVHVIGLCADVNHDGTIDTSFTGPDQTSMARPFRFWINDNDDEGEDKGDGLPDKGPKADMKWHLFNGQDVVDGVRDLVDFFPVYLHIGSLLKEYPVSALTVRLVQDSGGLYFVNPNLGLEQSKLYLTDTNIARSLASATANQINIGETVLGTNLLQAIRDNGKGIILIEAFSPIYSPLRLEVWQGTNLLAETQLELSISKVEDMFRHKNLIRATYLYTTNGPPDRLYAADVPNEPVTDDKNFVFIHGYNVNPNQARGSFSDTFKRMFWSGSHAKFYGVTWKGDDTQDIAWGKVATDYHVNVHHAFETAPHFANFLATLTNGPTTVVAHSLGNMVALSALSDCNARMSNYFMLDAAVAIEAIDGASPVDYQMAHSSWLNPEVYADRLYASYWWALFPTNDGRSTLTWSNRLANFRNTQVYNFFSSGEEVLRDFQPDPPLYYFENAGLLLYYWTNHPPAASFLWVWQEKGKGVAPTDVIIGSTHGGWKFNTNAPYYYLSNSILVHMPNAQASVLPAAQLQTNAFFDTSYDYMLFGPGGSVFATASRDRILSDAIPALSWAIGSHSVTNLDVRFSGKRNYDMQAEFENGWPLGRPQRQVGAIAPGEWHHSDFREPAYTFVYDLFNEFVSLGDLQ